MFRHVAVMRAGSKYVFLVIRLDSGGLCGRRNCYLGTKSGTNRSVLCLEVWVTLRHAASIASDHPAT